MKIWHWLIPVALGAALAFADVTLQIKTVARVSFTPPDGQPWTLDARPRFNVDAPWTPYLAGNGRGTEVSFDYPMLDPAQFFRVSLVEPGAGRVVTIAWDDSNPSGSVGGFRVYGNRDGEGYAVVQSCLLTQTVVLGLLSGEHWTFAATAVSPEGVESDLSDTVEYHVP